MKDFCRWREDEEAWFTSCGDIFVINEGTPEDNNMEFCCFCGKKLRQKLLPEDLQ